MASGRTPAVGADSDLFVFSGGSGDETAADFVEGADLLDLDGATPGFGDPTITRDGFDMLIGDGLADPATCPGITAGDITTDDFFFG